MNKLKNSQFLGLAILSAMSLLVIYLLIDRNSSNRSSSQLEKNSATQVANRGELTFKNSSGEQGGQTEVAPLYGGSVDNLDPLDIPLETPSHSDKTASISQDQSLPSGFGLEVPTDPNAANTNNPADQTANPQGKEGAEGQLQASPISLETPLDTKREDKDAIEVIDPREVGVTTNDGPDKDYEETVLSVQRTLTAVDSSGEKQLIRLKIPVMYRSRTLRLEGETKQRSFEMLARLKKKSEELARIKQELEQDLIDWNQLVKDSTPYEILLPESPTLPQNQSIGRINRDDNPSMSAGKSITYEIIE